MLRRKDKTHIEVGNASGESADGVAASQPPGGDGSDSAGDAVATEIAELRRQLDEEKDRNLRQRAEQQNMQRRAAQERADAVRFANAELIRRLLNPIDDFDRLLTHGGEGGAESVLQGVRLIYDNLLRGLKEHNVEVIDPLDAPFDPRCHEAMMQMPAEGKAPGTVTRVLQRGYKMHDRVLRPAKVVIASAPEGT